MSRASDLGKHFLIAAFVVFLYFAGQIRCFTSPTNRYCLHWGTHHALALIVDIFVLAVVVAAVAAGTMRLLRRLRWTWAEHVVRHVLPLAVVGGVLAAFPSFFSVYHPSAAKVAWLAAMLVTGYSLAAHKGKLVAWTRNFCLLFSPIVFIMSIQMLTWGTWWEPEKQPSPTRAEPAPRAPVFVIVFDGWGYVRSAENGQFRPLFKHVRQLCHQAFMFREARSAGLYTKSSLPALIWQTDQEFVVQGTDTFWSDGERQTPSVDVPSLFQKARAQGYHTCLVGWYLPYQRMLGDPIDYCATSANRQAGDTLIAEMGYAALRNLQYWTDPVSQRFAPGLDARIFAARRKRVHERALDKMLGLMRRGQDGQFAIFHLTVPHFPYIWNADGTYRGPGPRDMFGYERHLAYVDLLVGQIVAALREAGTFDSSLLVITSDHASKVDTEPTMQRGHQWARRVPLIVKLPGQTSPSCLDDMVYTYELGPLFEAVFAGNDDTDNLADLLHRIARADTREPAASGH